MVFRKFSFIFVVLVSLLLPVIIYGDAKTPNGFSISRGTNVSHWLSQRFPEHPVRSAIFSELDAQFLDDQGFDHIRMPVDEVELWDDQGDRIAENFELLHAGIKWCLKRNMRVVVDLHTVRAHHFNADFDGLKNTLFTSDVAQQTFLSLWTDLMDELGEYPNDSLAYELLNEAIADENEQWNGLVNKTIAHIRELEPQRTIVVGSNRWQRAENLHELRIPEGDKNLILSFHTYEPFLLTHHKAHWAEIGKYDGPVEYPGQIVSEEYLRNNFDDAFFQTMKNYKFDKKWSVEVIEEDFVEAARVAELHGLTVYCGEWGCLPMVGEKLRMRYYRDLISLFKKHDVAWANWDYKGSFGMINSSDQKIDWGLIDILVE